MAYTGLMITWLVQIIPIVWTSYVLPDADCKVLSPVELRKEVRLIATETTPITYYQYTGGSITDSICGLAFTLDHYYFPDKIDITDTTFTYSFLRETLDEFLSSIEGTIIYKDIQLKPGAVSLVWKASYLDNTGVGKGVATIYPDAYYGIQVFGKKDKKPEEWMGKYLDSFERVEKSK